MIGRELRTGGFFSRTELYADGATGLYTGYIYIANARLVLDVLDEL